MKKTAIAVALMAATGSANAALLDGSILNIGEGSFFTMGGGTGPVLAPGFDGQNITGFDGLVIGSTQTATGSHSGVPDGTESPTIDNPWVFFGNTGMHSTESASSIISASGNTATIDFSGWAVAWNGVESPAINMGSGAWVDLDGDTVIDNANGVANITCGVDCGDGDTYTLIYSATVPDDGTTNFGNTQYLLSLTGTVSAIPVPAAVWLFGSGLIGLAGVARRRKTA